METNLLETLQQAQYPVSPMETHVAVISIPLQAQTWWMITIKFQWTSCQRDRREWRYATALLFLPQQFWAGGLILVLVFGFPLRHKKTTKLYPINLEAHQDDCRLCWWREE